MFCNSLQGFWAFLGPFLGPPEEVEVEMEVEVQMEVEKEVEVEKRLTGSA